MPMLSFIRTLTVGSGIVPDLLPFTEVKALAGSRHCRIPPVGNFAPP
jgi:hypothetical protein